MSNFTNFLREFADKADETGFSESQAARYLLQDVSNYASETEDSDFREQVKEMADSICRKEYWDTVRECSEGVKQAVKDGEIRTMDEVWERLHEDCDGSRQVFITHLAIRTLLYSDNDGAYEEEFGGEVPDWSQLAFCALYRDVQEQLSGEVEDCDECNNGVVVDGECYGDDCAGEYQCEDCGERLEEYFSVSNTDKTGNGLVLCEDCCEKREEKLKNDSKV